MADTSHEERIWAMLCHLLVLAGWIIPFVGNIVAPLLVWALKKEGSEFINIQGKESLNFQITMSILGGAAFLLSFIFFGGGLLWIIGIFDVIMVIMASIKVANGEDYKYPWSLKLIK